MQSEKWFSERKSPRLKQYDYRTPNYYFVTICANDKKCIFGDPGKPNDLGKIAQMGLNMIEDNFCGVEINKAVIMPNHIHAIIVLTNYDHSLSAIVGSYKSYVTRKIHERNPNIKVWQSSFHEHIIRNQKGYERIWNYIENNPLKWEEDCFYAQS